MARLRLRVFRKLKVRTQVTETGKVVIVGVKRPAPAKVPIKVLESKTEGRKLRGKASSV